MQGLDLFCLLFYIKIKEKVGFGVKPRIRHNERFKPECGELMGRVVRGEVVSS